MKSEKFLTTGCIGKNWQDDYKRKLVSASEAVSVVKSGDRVVFPICSYPRALGPALAERKNELRNVTIHSEAAMSNDLWMFYEEDQTDEIFYPTTWYIHELARKAPAGTDSKRTVYLPGTWSQMMKPFDERPDECPFSIDVVMVTLSPPDKYGFCSFGANLWNNRGYCKRATKVIAQVDETVIRTGGTNHIHVSEIDYFVEATPERLTDDELEKILSQTAPEVRKLVEPIIPKIVHSRRKWIVSMLPEFNEDIAKMMLNKMTLGEPPPGAAAIAGYISEIVKDGDTFNIGHGSMTAWIGPCGAFNNKQDLGFYSEGIWPGIAKLVENGIITGKHKTFHPGKVTVSALSQGHQEDLDFIDNNPVFECYDSEFMLDIRNVAQNNNFVAINQASSVDLTGRINAESSMGGRMISGPGGQPELHIGGILSEGGRSVIVLSSTALNGAVSSIVPQFDKGMVVTIPRYFADYIVTEYGIAKLMGKDCRQRADELIAISHPDFRSELKKDAQNLFYP